MRVMVIVKATNESEDGELPPPELLQQMGAFNDQLRDAGILVDAAGLRPSGLWRPGSSVTHLPPFKNWRSPNAEG